MPVPSGSDTVERAVERAIVLFAKAMVAMAFVVAIYGILVGVFFTCCGMDAFSAASFANPARSRLGPIVTILVVWPVGGLICLLLQSVLGDILHAVGKKVHATIQAIRLC